MSLNKEKVIEGYEKGIYKKASRLETCY